LRYEEAIADAPPVEPGDTLLVVVGRGSSDPQAAAETREFAALRSARQSFGRVVTAFTALCEPLLDDVLREAAAAPFGRVVVQPHLLFAGELAGRVRRQTEAAAASAPKQQWRIASHLGPHALVVAAVAEEIAAAVRPAAISSDNERSFRGSPA
jgi:sirohydrochlorin cobaltochelatase